MQKFFTSPTDPPKNVSFALDIANGFTLLHKWYIEFLSQLPAFVDTSTGEQERGGKESRI